MRQLISRLGWAVAISCGLMMLWIEHRRQNTNASWEMANETIRQLMRENSDLHDRLRALQTARAPQVAQGSSAPGVRESGSAPSDDVDAD